MKTILFSAVLMLFAGSVFSATILVPSEQSTIQAGIDAAENGDTVLVKSGTYTGDGNRDIDFTGKGIVIKSTGGPDSTFIYPQSSPSERHNAFRFVNGEDSTSELIGFRIAGGSSETLGGAIVCRTAAPSIVDCIFSSNSAEKGGAIALWRSSPSFVRCVFSNNSASSEGGAMYCDQSSSPIIDRCTFESNTSYMGGAISYWFSNGTVTYSLFKRNTASSGDYGGVGGAIYFRSSSPTFANCTFIYNDCQDGGTLYCGYGSLPRINNSIIRPGSSPGTTIGCYTGYVPRLSCCNITSYYSWYSSCISGQAETNGNFSLDPQFCDLSNNFGLESTSPCLPNNNSCGVLIGAFGAACDSTQTGVPNDAGETFPDVFHLFSNYPNPFNPTTTIEFSLPTRSHVTISVYNLLGQRVKTLFDGKKTYGPHSIIWDGTDQKGRAVGTGIYFYQIKAGEYMESKKMLLLK